MVSFIALELFGRIEILYRTEFTSRFNISWWRSKFHATPSTVSHLSIYCVMSCISGGEKAKSKSSLGKRWKAWLEESDDACFIGELAFHGEFINTTGHSGVRFRMLAQTLFRINVVRKAELADKPIQQLRCARRRRNYKFWPRTDGTKKAFSAAL